MVAKANHYIFYINSICPGSANDSRVLRNSPLFETFENGWRPFPDAVLLGDSGFPLLDWLMTLIFITTNNNTDNYNIAHKRSCHFIETTFGVLKSRFACLSSKLRFLPEFCAEVIYSCCIIHNMILNERFNDADFDNVVNQEDNDIDTNQDLLNEEDEIINPSARAREQARRARLVQRLAAQRHRGGPDPEERQ